ncbi:MAG: hypothetical protein JW963_12495, partial [Anaerolineales bacterium]|nr:hypothetical protein [Anaerolineales bacterium]
GIQFLHAPGLVQDDFEGFVGRRCLRRWERTLSKNLTLQFRKTVYQIQTSRPTYALRHAAVTVCLDAHNNISILYKGKALDYTIFHQQSKQAEMVDVKQVNLAIQAKTHQPAPNHPWRKGFATPLSKSRDVPPQGDISTLDIR